jgi:flagellar biosynthesis chaperone FliJ
MKQILKPLEYMTLILIGGIAQIASMAIIKALGLNDANDSSVYLLSFLGVFGISIIVFEIAVVATWRSRKAKSSNTMVERSTYDHAKESRTAVIKNLRNTEKEMAQERQRFETTQISIKTLEKERDSWKKASETAENKLTQERRNLESAQTSIKSLEKERDSWKKASETAENKLTQERRNLESAQTSIKSLEKERDSWKKASETAEGKLAQERRNLGNAQSSLRTLEKERDSWKKASETAENKLTQERRNFENAQTSLRTLEKERDNWKKASETAENKLTQERRNFENAQTSLRTLEKERDSLKKANESTESKWAQEQRHVKSLEQEGNYYREAILKDITTEDTFILVSTKAWKEAGDSNEIQKWKELFSKIRNPSQRSQQERPNGDGWVYPSSRSGDGRRVMYLRETKEVNIIKVCHIFRTHDNNKEYSDRRTKGMESREYTNVIFSYIPMQTTI